MKLFLVLLITGFQMLFIQTYAHSKINLIPAPQKLEYLDGSFVISPNISFKTSGDNDKLSDYLKTYIEKLYKFKFVTGKIKNTPTISLAIDKNFMSSKPAAYSMVVTPHKITIISSEERGLFYGVQTLFQLLPKNISGNGEIKIQACKIIDYPAFAWRGLNLDCARHFMTKDFIKRYIDILAYYKFNILHWHLTDDQGWRIEIKRYPKLTSVGAWRTEPDGSIYGGYYTQKDIKEIVAYAKKRFITIVPEIEMPGHCMASLAAYPENSCTGGPFEVPITWGVFKDVYCAGRDSTFQFLENILDEVINLFPGKYIHIGGDEVPKDRWKACPRCQARIKAEGLKDEEGLQSYFIKRISKYLTSKGKQVIGWDEILQGGLAPGAIVESWQGMQGAEEAAGLGHYVICSPASHTYLDSDPADLNLRTVYSFEPIPDGLPQSERKFILGSEASLWTERTPQNKVDQQLFPRLLALSEVLWTNPRKRDFDEFRTRVEHSYADLTARGIKYGPESKAVSFKTSYDEADKKFTVDIISNRKDLKIRYTENGDDPDSLSPVYTAPVEIDSSVKLKISAFRDNRSVGKKINLAFDFHKALNAKITLKNKYDERYRAGGENALIDGIRGTDNFKDGLWQGYDGVDFEGVIDLGSEKKIKKVTPRFMLNSSSWIFLPKEVIISISKDGKNYFDKQVIKNNIPQKNPDIVLKDFPACFNGRRARYIKVIGRSIKTCPPWHPGAGQKAWLFIDEIEVE